MFSKRPHPIELMTASHPPFDFSLRRMIVASIRHSWRLSAAVALGVATATAVIVGALLVGDSMRGSLKALTIERLGRTETMIAPAAFFAFDGVIADGPPTAAALIFFPTGSIETRTDDGDLRRAGSVQIVGGDEAFWNLDASGVRPKTMPNDDGVVLNASAAAELGVDVGDTVTLRLPSEQAVPADSPLGRRDIRGEGLPRMTVLDIIPDRGLGRFSVSPSQAAPLNVYASRDVIAETLDRDGQANMILVDRELVQDDLNLDLDDFGLSLRLIERTYGADDEASPTTIFRYASLTSDRLLLPDAAAKRLTGQLPTDDVIESLTYLANAIERLDGDGNVVASVPYSIITAIDQLRFSGAIDGDSVDLDYDLGVKEIPVGVVPLVINDWTARRLDAAVGTPLRIAYYEPEVENGNEIERYFEAVVTQIVPITEPASPYRRRREATFDKPPTLFNDPGLTPMVPGVTDQDSISDWDLPFPLQRPIENEDDVYWNNYRLTPKAFLPLDAGRRLFGSRFGDTTGLRIRIGDGDDALAELRGRVTRLLDPVRDDLGWSIRPVKAQQLAASRGTTPFDGLFLALSFFVILSAVILIAMLFRLGLVARMKQYGTLMAVGWTPRRVSAAALGEGMIVAAVGVLVGVAGGIGYAAVVLWALRSWWVGAVTVPFLTFHWTPKSLIVGGSIGWIVATLTLAVTIRWLLKFDAQTLLSGRDLDVTAKPRFQRIESPDGAAHGDGSRRSRLPIVATALLIAAIAAGVAGASAGGQAASGGFVGGGMLLLMASLSAIYYRLCQPRRVAATTGQTYSLTRMIGHSASRNPMRSTMTIGLMAVAAFLIIAIGAFRLQPTDKGTGGFTLIGETAAPLYRDLSDASVQADLLGPDRDAMTGVGVLPMRLRPGQDASCNNLYRATQPTVIGVPDRLATRISVSNQNGGPLVGFDWVATETLKENASPWTLLQSPAAGTPADPIPVVIDQNTAMWSLQMTGGIGEVKAFEYEAGKPIYVRVVGLLSNSMLQGRLMIGEDNFETAFPDISGYRLFLIDAPEQQGERVSSVLESRLGDLGMDVSRTEAVLAGMLAVQNTYLNTFQSLGALGLLLGTIGLAVAQLRSVLERRVELAVMRAIGFTRGRLSTIVLGETAILLLLGIGCGAACAVLAVLPYSWISGLRPPIVAPVLLVAAIIAFGMTAGLVAVRQVGRMPLIESLRAD